MIGIIDRLDSGQILLLAIILAIIAAVVITSLAKWAAVCARGYPPVPAVAQAEEEAGSTTEQKEDDLR